MTMEQMSLFKELRLSEIAIDLLEATKGCHGMRGDVPLAKAEFERCRGVLCLTLVTEYDDKRHEGITFALSEDGKMGRVFDFHGFGFVTVGLPIWEMLGKWRKEGLLSGGWAIMDVLTEENKKTIMTEKDLKGENE